VQARQVAVSARPKTARDSSPSCSRFMILRTTKPRPAKATKATGTSSRLKPPPRPPPTLAAAAVSAPPPASAPPSMATMAAGGAPAPATPGEADADASLAGALEERREADAETAGLRVRRAQLAATAGAQWAEARALFASHDGLTARRGAPRLVIVVIEVVIAARAMMAVEWCAVSRAAGLKKVALCL
jgi:hypothetical protein